jgi:dihydrofolate synthase/folylpolyglutamate synthase
MRRSPAILIDAAHNPHGARATAAALAESFDFERVVGVLAVLRGKDVHGLLSALEPILDEVVITTNSSPRCLPADDLADEAMSVFGELRVTIVPVLADAIDQAASLAEEAGLYSAAGVLITGSVVTAGDARRLLVRRSG